MSAAASKHERPATPPVPPNIAEPADDGGSLAALPKELYVLDTTAVIGKGSRTHIMPVDGVAKPFTFEPARPTKLPVEVAIKFLKIPAFLRTDEHGNPLPYRRQPKQPEELGAGEAFRLNDNETIADLGELTNAALVQRAMELSGGEVFCRANPGKRQAVIEFLIAAKKKKREENMEGRQKIAQDKPVRQPTGVYDSDEFMPEAE